MKEIRENDIGKKNLEIMTEDQKNIRSDSKLAKLVQEGYYTKKITSVTNHVIILKTLSAKERAAAYDLAGFNVDIESLNLEAEDKENKEEVKKQVREIRDQIDSNKCALLAYSLVSLDGEDYTDIDKAEIFDMIGSLNGLVLDLLYLEYQRMQNEYFENVANLESFKKK